ncbi:hypothetical protein [Roseovarius sp.]|uniref:hypothetical protein n=1 Tax=Roseovarius sp. TaxID=1486281 RepID=UPI0025D230CB|nr:hypothetical protein [Roseovarius sp.]
MELLLSLIAGAVGGNVAGGVMKAASLGFLGNSLVGIAGGGLGGHVLMMLGVGGLSVGTGGGDLGAIIAQVVSGGLGGGVLMIVIGQIKKMVLK